MTRRRDQSEGPVSRRSAHPTVVLPPFFARAPWWTGDLQTIRNFLTRTARRSRAALRAWPLERRWVACADRSGDRLAAAIQCAQDDAAHARPVVVLVHGLGGNEESSYMQAAAWGWLRSGHRVVRQNLRGAGISRRACRFQYDAGSTNDLRTALRSLAERFPGAAFALVGFSLGGTLVVRLAAEGAPGVPIASVTAVSAPLDLAAAARRLLARRNALYHRRILRKLKRQITEPAAELTPSERRAVENATTLVEIDEVFTAPRAGFRSAAEYYADRSASCHLAASRYPTLALHARDDPWIPVSPYWEVLAARESLPAWVRVVVAQGGGHLGFHGRDPAQPWHQICAEAFVAAHPDASARDRANGLSGLAAAPDGAEQS